MYIQRISGLIPANKQLEFEQTYRFVVTQLPENCSAVPIAKDAIHDCVYHITFQSESLQILKSFTSTPIFTMLIGAFQTLGKLCENKQGKWFSIQPP
ncbi:MAG TPA: hypothetical protein VFN95_13220 [Flavitalea sp.]|nr:hypothetical protein [Flavitalea sp.]